ncbi:MAG: DUF1987 domain-containing protein [Flavobacteriales bacterium]|nr:DUF1987 domain-containing protein [Flavobacteriales bacterium]MBL4735996.1 DUF1987 domain-containing protein [Flavobacteriales bacterium]PCH87106.1 MAG: nuclear pore complex subunit [Flavobacteriales bacterium]
MEAINLKGTYDTPDVVLDSEQGVFEISGRSYPEDTAEFYIPILEWINNYLENPNSETRFTFKLDYFNSSSYKPFLDILVKLGKLNSNGHSVTIQWYYKEGDWDIKEAGEEFAEIVDVPFTYDTF